MAKTAKELRQSLGEIHDQFKKIIERAETEKRKRTDEEEASLATMNGEMSDIEKDIDLADMVEARTATLAKPQTRGIRPSVATADDDPAKAEEAQRNVEKDFRTRFGMVGQHIARRMPTNKLATREYRTAFDRWLIAPKGSGVSTLTADEQRALSVGTASEGGHTVPQEEFLAELIKTVDNMAVIRGISRTFQVPQAQSLGAPTLSADPSDPTWTTELLVGAEDSTMAFGKRELRPWPLAKYIKVSDKLLRASPLGMESIVRERLAYKQAVAHSTAFNTGSGVNEPLGLFTESANGLPGSGNHKIDVATTGVLDADKIIAARFVLRQGYWPNARWLMHRNWLAKLRILKTTDNYLWQPGLTIGAPSTFLDFPYVIDEYSPSTTTGGQVYAAILGDFSNYWIVDALEIRLQRLDELFALTNQVGFVIRSETDAAPVLSDAFVRLAPTMT